MQNRYWQRNTEPDEPTENAFLWTKRHASRPNKVWQTVKDLVPGRLYSVEMITVDHDDMKNGRFVEARHAVSLTIEDAQGIPEMSYRSIPVKTSFLAPQLSYFKQGPPILNRHRVMFRAKGQTARLVISDWASDQNAGGWPSGREAARRDAGSP